MATSAMALPAVALAGCGSGGSATAGGKVTFQGKTLTAIIAAPVGGGEDLIGRTQTQMLIQKLPGMPRVEYKTIVGGAGIAGANLFVQTGSKDGLTIAYTGRSLPIAQLLGDPAIQFDVRQFEWVGSYADDAVDDDVLMVRSDTGINNFDDLLSTTKPIHFGAGNPRVVAYVIPALLARDTKNPNLQVISGIDTGTAAALVTIERGELQGYVETYGSIEKLRPDWLKPGGFMKVVARRGTYRDMPGIPQYTDRMSESSKQMLLLTRLGWGDPATAPPGSNADALAVLRQAFDAAVKDPAVLEIPKKANVMGKPLTSSEIKAIIDKVFSVPPDVVGQFKELIGAK